MRDIFEKFPREDQNPGGGVVPTPPPPGRPKVDFYLGRPRVKHNIKLGTWKTCKLPDPAAGAYDFPDPLIDWREE